MKFAKGDRLDRFEIREQIGQGGMGAIYRAVDTKLGRTVALKVVRTGRLDTSAGEQVRQRFLRETLAMSKVEHPNVVRILDFGFSGEAPYLVMEHLRGQDLGKLIKSTAAYFPIPEVIDVMLEVCAAIRACHDAGIIHRDLKPSNIFLCETESERVVKLLDFGVSKPPIADDLTREGQIVGTPQYLAPEQIEGNVVPQTDQYAVGVMLYACLTKSLPYQDYKSFALLRAIVAGKFTPPRELRLDIPEKLEQIILRAMRTAPEARYESIHVLGRELLPFAGPVAQQRLRPYYFDERLLAAPKPTTHPMPLIEAMARGLATPTQPKAPGGRETMVDPEGPPDEATPTPPAGAREGSISIQIETPVVAGVTEPPTPAPGGSNRAAWAALVALSVVALAAGGWLILGRSRGAAPAAVAPATPAPSKAVAGGMAPAPEAAAPAALAPPVPAAVDAQGAPGAVLPGTAAAAEENAPEPSPAAPAGKRRRHGGRRSAPEPASDVPIMP